MKPTAGHRLGREAPRLPVCVGIILAALALLLLPSASLAATRAYDEEEGKEDDGCAVLCTPELKIEPTITFEPLFRRPVIEELEDGRVVSRTKPGRETGLELVVSLGIPTTIPRVGFTVETILKPFANVDNEPEVELELNLGLIEPDQTGGGSSRTSTSSTSSVPRSGLVTRAPTRTS